MTAQILPFPPRPKASTPSQQWPADHDAYLIALGRTVARRGEDISDDEARNAARDILGALAATRVIVSGMSDEERQQRLSDMIEQAFAEAAPRVPIR